MKKQNFSILLSVLALFLFALPGIAAVSAYSAPAATSGVVFTQTNSATGNRIQAFYRASNGILTSAGTFSTHGLGTGAGLGDQGALALDGNWLFTINAGSNQLSAFRVSGASLKFTDIVSSRGVSPLSVTAHGDWVYVVNAGNAATAGNIASGPTTTTDHGTEPFGFAFDPNGQLVVSEAATGSLSSYSVSSSGTLTLITGSVVDGGVAPCWVAITGNGAFAYTANAHGNTISSLSISHSGALTLQQSVATTTNITPLDLAFGGNSHYLYSFNSGSDDIMVFTVDSNGELSFLQTIGGLQTGGAGLAAV